MTDVEESTVVSDKQSLPQYPDDDDNTTASAVRIISEERRYNIRIWLTRRNEDISEKERDLGHIGLEMGGRNTFIERLKMTLQEEYIHVWCTRHYY
jgi:hypothetical protein